MIHTNELAELQSPAQSLAGAVKPPLVERRRSRRCRTELNAVVHWLDESAVVRDCSGILRNISVDGFGVETKQTVPVGRPVMVRMTSAALNGVVRHVQESPDGFLVGIEISPSSNSHLNALRKLNAALDSLAAPNLERS